MRATWYVLEDGTYVDPSECSRKDGLLTHKNGPVAMRRPGLPRSTGVDLDEAGKPLLGGKGAPDVTDTAGGAKQPESEPEPAPAAEPAPVVTEVMAAEPEPAPAPRPAYKRRGR